MLIAIAHGLVQTRVAVESINCELAFTAEITTAVQASDGLIIGSSCVLTPILENDTTLSNHFFTYTSLSGGKEEIRLIINLT